MSREIMFRAWDKAHKRMVQIRTAYFRSKPTEYAVFTEVYKAGYRLTEDNIILMQYTGLKDKNGKELDWWEGDLFNCMYSDLVFTIVFEDGIFWFKCSNMQVRYHCFLMIDDERTKKIGNIHENPELIK